MKKIMFNDKYGLTRAVLDGRKTQTRRIATRQQMLTILGLPKHADYHMDELAEACAISYEKSRFSPYAVGEEVAVAQSYKDAGCDFYFHRGLAGWNNKMFVRAYEMPHRIKITKIRIERLQDISDADCLKEGVFRHTVPPKHHEYDFYSPWSPSVKPFKFESEKFFCSAKYAFMYLIEKVCGKGTWQKNPWVLVFDFELINNNYGSKRIQNMLCSIQRIHSESEQA